MVGLKGRIMRENAFTCQREEISGLGSLGSLLQSSVRGCCKHRA